ncbi:hypothetical protein GCM10027162_68490 [Streptomyces incanus]
MRRACPGQRPPGDERPLPVRTPPARPVTDDGRHRAAPTQGASDRRELFTDIDGAEATWPDGLREEVDTTLLTTGYRPDPPCLAGLGGPASASSAPARASAATTATGATPLLHPACGTVPGIHVTWSPPCAAP